LVFVFDKARIRSALLIAAFAFICLDSIGHSEATTDDGRCEQGQRADDFPGWEFIANNARRTADEYAIQNNPAATFVIADVDAHFQVAGEYEGIYLVKLLYHAGDATDFAMLKPNFDFCGDPERLDDSRADLFTVVVAKRNGVFF